MEDRFAGKAEWFDEHYRAVRGRVRLELVLERLSRALPPPPARILDVGGGTGAFAIPLAHLGHRVTVLDQSAEWLDRARSSATAAEVEVDLLNLSLDALADADLGSFDAILCHAVLMYVEASKEALVSLRAVAAPGAVFSLLEKNRDGIALRPGLRGDYAEAYRLLTERESVGGLGVANRAYSADEWHAMLRETGWSRGLGRRAALLGPCARRPRCRCIRRPAGPGAGGGDEGSVPSGVPPSARHGPSHA